MTSAASDKRPLSATLLQISCLVATVTWVLITVLNWNSKMLIMGTRLKFSHLFVLYTAFWLITTVGILKLKKWGWAFAFGLGLLTFLSTANLLLTPSIGRMSVTVIFGSFIGLVFLLLPNMPAVRSAYKIDLVQGKQVPGELITFALICTATGFFIFFELFTGFRIAPGTTMVKLFVSGIGLVYILLGTGVWRLSPVAIQSIEPALIFTLFALGFIFIKDYVDGSRSFHTIKSVFYFCLIAGMTIYWKLRLHSTANDLTGPSQLKPDL